MTLKLLIICFCTPYVDHKYVNNPGLGITNTFGIKLSTLKFSLSSLHVSGIRCDYDWLVVCAWIMLDSQLCVIIM